MQNSIGLFYGSSTCYTEMAAEKIRDAIHLKMPAQPIDIHNIANDCIQLIPEYSYLILGIPTWDYGELQEDWETHWQLLDDLDLSHTKVAIFGLGDQIGYPQWFQDALGYLWAKMVNQGATAVGLWPNQGYDFEQSKALTDDKKFFLGLALDDENQLDLTDQYINQWCQQILYEFGLLSHD
ncbi:MAG: flavodoxin FldB [Porticoccaceae bacterium]|nr:flavodoxin FldB [Porticoccaceae bacterium]